MHEVLMSCILYRDAAKCQIDNAFLANLHYQPWQNHQNWFGTAIAKKFLGGMNVLHKWNGIYWRRSYRDK